MINQKANNKCKHKNLLTDSKYYDRGYSWCKDCGSFREEETLYQCMSINKYKEVIKKGKWIAPGMKDDKKGKS